MSSLVWKNISQELNIPAILLPWIANADSMTRALEEVSGVQCQIIVQKKGWQMPWEDECDALLMNDECWIREVVIIAREPVIFARSVFPKKLVEHFPALMNLGSQPLGKTIFAEGNHAFQRGPIDVAKIKESNFLWEQIPAALRVEKHWARRSLFHSAVLPFLLSEVFLPALVKMAV